MPTVKLYAADGYRFPPLVKHTFTDGLLVSREHDWRSAIEDFNAYPAGPVTTLDQSGFGILSHVRSAGPNFSANIIEYTAPNGQPMKALEILDAIVEFRFYTTLNGIGEWRSGWTVGLEDIGTDIEGAIMLHGFTDSSGAGPETADPKLFHATSLNEAYPQVGMTMTRFVPTTGGGVAFSGGYRAIRVRTGTAVVQSTGGAAGTQGAYMRFPRWGGVDGTQEFASAFLNQCQNQSNLTSHSFYLDSACQDTNNICVYNEPVVGMWYHTFALNSVTAGVAHRTQRSTDYSHANVPATPYGYDSTFFLWKNTSLAKLRIFCHLSRINTICRL